MSNSDVSPAEGRVGFRGKRHPLKGKRWQVVSCSDPFLKDTWLDCVAAKDLLKSGDFYPPYTRIKIVHLGIEVTVKGKEIFNEDGDPVKL